ncbi:hypothetical protein ASG87_15605 [Frateuria sp. Soil773]|uniref:DUF2182 domain-containing protein n=1 Tax=Frateuria sp. Soil773 TaxID=1736407 RepID=UPI0006F82779|nr:DUF2182 domain-containing protein [Frateuria sp. Soil773]KRE97674.1 hypothetical protein ASG87_15605 [Frateuria sp. Soil773]
MGAGATAAQSLPGRAASWRDSGLAFAAACGLFFAAAVAATVVGSLSMPAMGGMPMPGGWTLSMAWMRMCGQAWPAHAASFLGMCIAMTAAMMLPSLAPALWRHRRAVREAGGTCLGSAATLAATGYFLAWAALGMAVYPLGVALAAAEMQLPALARAVPVATGVVVLVAGALQFTAWKAHHLACCGGTEQAAPLLPGAGGALWHGLRLGRHCCCSCAGFTAALLATGVMDLRAMAVVTAAITAERLAPSGQRVVQAIGVVAVAAGVWLIARAVAG